MKTDIQDEKIIEKAVKLSLIEVLLGSVMHALYIPLGGHLLSLNQGAFLCSFIEKSQTRSQSFKMLFEISIVTSTMKALSPAGKKLGPMISISMQGFLFGLGILIGGTHFVGQCLGMILLSLWAFVQPFITYYLMFGSDLIAALSYFSEKLTPFLPTEFDSIYLIAFSAVAIKALISLSIPFLVKRINFEKMEKFITRNQMTKQVGQVSTFKGVIKDLTRPLFLLSVLLMVSYFFFSGTSQAIILWKTLRAIAIAAVIFYLTRSKYVLRFFEWLGTKNEHAKRILFLSSQALKRFFKIISHLN